MDSSDAARGNEAFTKIGMGLSCTLHRMSLEQSPLFGIGISSFQRSGPLSRLLDSIELAVSETNISTHVVVCLDGSTDDSQEMANARIAKATYQLTVVWQQNKGLSAARNRCAAEFTNEIVWMLDDDMMVTPEALRHHYQDCRRAFEFVVGPCEVQSSCQSVHTSAAASFYERRHARLVDECDGEIRDPRDFSAANTSAPAEVWRKVGFDEDFQGYGFEDYDFAARAFAEGYRARFEPGAVVVHDMHLTSYGKLRQHRAEGINRVMFARLHPEFGRTAFPNKPEPTEAWVRERARDWASRPLWFGAIGAWLLSVLAPKRFKPSIWNIGLTCAGYSGVANAKGTGLAQRLTVPKGEFASTK